MARPVLCDKCGKETKFNCFELEIRANKFDLCNDCVTKLIKFLYQKELTK